MKNLTKPLMVMMIVGAAVGMLGACNKSNSSDNGGGTVSINNDGTCSTKLIANINSYRNLCVAWEKSPTDANLQSLVATCDSLTSTHSESTECTAQSLLSADSDVFTKDCFGFSKNAVPPSGQVTLKLKAIHQICAYVRTKVVQNTPISPAPTPPPAAEPETTKNTAFKDIDVTKIVIKVLDAVKIKQLAASEDNIAVDGLVGTVESLAAKIIANHPPLCILTSHSGGTWKDVKDGQVFKVLTKIEKLRRFNRNSISIFLTDLTIGIACENLTGAPFTTDDFNSALKGILSIEVSD